MSMVSLIGMPSPPLSIVYDCEKYLQVSAFFSLYYFARSCIIYTQHDDGAGQEKTVETALIRQTDRAMTSRGSERKEEADRHAPTTHTERSTTCSMDM